MATRRKPGARPQISRALTPMQERFAYEYIKDLNATQAAIRAGYASKAAFVQGSRLLSKVSVHSLVEKLKAEQKARLKMSADEVLEEIAKIARSNIKRVFSPDSKALLSPCDMSDEDAAAVEAIEARLQFGADGAPPDEIVKVKMHSKLGALTLLAKHHGIIGAEVQVNLGAELANKLAAARKRARKEA